MKEIIRDIDYVITDTIKFWSVIAAIPFLFVCFIVAFSTNSVPYWVWSLIVIALSFPIGKYAQYLYDKRKNI